MAPVRQAYEPSPREPGWEPLTSSKTYKSQEQRTLTGDIKGRFTELSLVHPVHFDHDGPIWTRERDDAPGVFEVTALQSSLLETKPQTFSAVERKLLPLGAAVLSALFDDDPKALAAVGRFMLYSLQDLAAAIIYLNRAYAKGAPNVAIDLAVATLFINRPVS